MVLDLDKKNNRQGYRDGKQGMLLKLNACNSYKKGWVKGFKKFILKNPERFFDFDKQNVVEEISNLVFCGLTEATACMLRMEIKAGVRGCAVVLA